MVLKKSSYTSAPFMIWTVCSSIIYYLCYNEECVPQGSVLGQVLYFIFITSLPTNFRSSVHLLADDCALYRDFQILQDDLNSLAQWEPNWQTKFNVT